MERSGVEGLSTPPRSALAPALARITRSNERQCSQYNRYWPFNPNDLLLQNWPSKIETPPLLVTGMIPYLTDFRLSPPWRLGVSGQRAMPKSSTLPPERWPPLPFLALRFPFSGPRLSPPLGLP